MNTTRIQLRRSVISWLTLVLTFSVAHSAGAASSFLSADIGQKFGLGTNTDFRQIILNLTSYLLGFVGLLAVLVVLYGGFLWMLSFGNEERIAKARATLVSGFVGLVIILSAYALVAFSITILNNALSSP